MANHHLAQSGASIEDAHIWTSLKQAIANSSGFKRWQRELSPAEVDTTPLDVLVQKYLRETLETLAY